MFKPIMQETCDPEVPEQFAAWAVQFVQRPTGEPVQIMPQFAPFTSAALWALGFRHHPEEQTHQMAEDGTLVPIEKEVSEGDSTG